MQLTMVSGGKLVMGPENLYGDMPAAGMEQEDDAAEKKRKDEVRRQKQNFNLPPEDASKAGASPFLEEHIISKGQHMLWL